MNPPATETTVPLPDGQSLRAVVAIPRGDGPHPGVVVLHESFGLNDDIIQIARRFAGGGYAALAPSLYSHGNRARCLARLMVSTWRGENEAAVSDVLAARDALAALPDVDEQRVVVAGFCQGGGFALAAGTQPGFRAAAVNYGHVPPERSRLAGLCPVVASFGGKDRMYGATMADRLEAHLSALGIDHDIKTYDGVGHSFMNMVTGWQGWLASLPSPLKVGYSQAEADDAWQRMLAFFARQLETPSPHT